MEDIEREYVQEVPADVKVHPLYYRADQRRLYTVIVDRKEKEAWLLPTEEVPGDFEFTLTIIELASLPRPYGFVDEIKTALPSVTDVQHALWSKGIITKDDLRHVPDVKRALDSVLPSANAFVQFVKEH